ncbi:MAG: hypothetical protein KBC95_00645 [Candidatus Peribacteraceae bacterium]|nr:hypothetical protein [Candidatus Peribacteraceae bacterium]
MTPPIDTPSAPDRPTPDDVRCQLEAVRYDIRQARISTDRAERGRVARDTHTRLGELRALVARLEGADRTAVQGELDTVARDHTDLSVSALGDADTPAPDAPSAEPEPVDQPVPPAPELGTGVFRPPHPTPTTMTQRLDNAIARMSFYAGRAGRWVRERFSSNPAAAPIMTAIGMTAVMGMVRQLIPGGGGAVTSAVETQLTTNLNSMAGAGDILAPLQNQLQVVRLAISRVRGDENNLQILKTLQTNAVSAGTDANAFLLRLAQAAGRRFRGSVTLAQLVTLAQETPAVAPAATVASINMPADGIDVRRGMSQTFILTPATAQVTVNGTPLTATAPRIVGQLTVTRTGTGLRIQRSATPAPAATVTLAVGAPPTAIMRALRVAA